MPYISILGHHRWCRYDYQGIIKGKLIYKTTMSSERQIMNDGSNET